MSVENILLEKYGRANVNRILDFLNSLIIKINQEAKEFETKETFMAWIKYKQAMEESDSIYDYTYGKLELNNAGFSDTEIEKLDLLRQSIVYQLILSGNNNAKLLLSRLRLNRINSYVEYNKYYIQFQGKIPDPSQNIYVKNLDSEEEGAVLLVTEVKAATHPNTYENIFIKRTIDRIISENSSFLYLRFIEYPLTIYYVRSAEQFTILYYDKKQLSDEEYNNFIVAYQENRYYALKFCYIKGFESRFDFYIYLIEILLLLGTFTSYFTKLMDSYTLSTYTDREIYDILDSWNLKSLKYMTLEMIKRFIKFIPELIEIKGSNGVLNRIMDIIGDKSVTVKRFYLEKVYNTDINGYLSYDTRLPPEDNMNIIFTEEIIRKNNRESTMDADATFEYHSLTAADDLWGGVAGLSDDRKTQLREALKKEILKLDFSRMATKYITLASVVDVYDKQIQVRYYLGLIFQYAKTKSNFLTKDVCTILAYTVTPMCLFAGICWLSSYMNKKTDPDAVTMDAKTISNVMILRNVAGTQELIKTMRDNRVMLPSGRWSRKLSEILGDDFNYSDNLVSFSSDTTISDILSQYTRNHKLIAMVRETIASATDLEEYEAWTYIFNSNMISQTYEDMFEGATTYSSYMETISPPLVEWIKDEIRQGDDSKSLNVLNELLTSFSIYIAKKTNDIVVLPTGEEQNETLSYLNDLTILFNEFMSIYNQLYKVEFTQEVNDVPFNKLLLMYEVVADSIDDSYSDNMRLRLDKLSDLYIHTVGPEYLNNFQYFQTHEELANIEYDHWIKTLLRDNMEYERIDDHFLHDFKQSLSVSHVLIDDLAVSDLEERLSLKDMLYNDTYYED
jgi:hypothetical protein